MAVIKAIHSNASIRIAVQYIERPCKTEAALITGISCSPDTAVAEMMVTKKIWKKDTGRSYDHYIQSFAPEEKISPEEAHTIAVEWAEQEFPGFEVIIATHVDTKHLHSHILVNAVSYIDGHKIHTSRLWLEEAKQVSDEICLRHGLTVTKKGYDFDGFQKKNPAIWSKNDYHLLQRAKRGEVRSYIYDIACKTKNAQQRAHSQDEYIDLLTKVGVSVCWDDSRRDITYTDAAGHKIRSSRLEKITGIPQSKEALEFEFKRHNRHH